MNDKTMNIKTNLLQVFTGEKLLVTTGSLGAAFLTWIGENWMSIAVFLVIYVWGAYQSTLDKAQARRHKEELHTLEVEIKKNQLTELKDK